jgi:hypothetical protein
MKIDKKEKNLLDFLGKDIPIIDLDKPPVLLRKDFIDFLKIKRKVTQSVTE